MDTFETQIPRNLVKIQAEQMWVPIYFHDQWMAAVRMVSQDGQPVVGEIRVFPRENDTPFDELQQHGIWSGEFDGYLAKAPRGGLSIRLLRKLKLGPIGEFMEVLARSMSLPIARYTRVDGQIGTVTDIINPPADIAPPGYEQEFSRLRTMFSAKRKVSAGKKRERKPDSFFAQLAAEYVRLVNSGSTRPVAEMANRLKIPRSKLRDMLHEARKRELLTDRGPGVPGGQLTALAKELLSQQSEAKKGTKSGRQRPRKTKS